MRDHVIVTRLNDGDPHPFSIGAKLTVTVAWIDQEEGLCFAAHAVGDNTSFSHCIPANHTDWDYDRDAFLHSILASLPEGAWVSQSSPKAEPSVNILDMPDNKFAVSGGRIWRHQRWQNKKIPGVGKCTVRRIETVDEPELEQVALRGWGVEVFDTIEEARRALER